MKKSTADTAKDALVLTGHGFQAIGRVARNFPLGKTLGAAAIKAGLDVIDMAETVCDQDQALATRECHGPGKGRP